MGELQMKMGWEKQKKLERLFENKGSKETSDTLILPVRELAKDIAYNYKQINVEEDERLL